MDLRKRPQQLVSSSDPHPDTGFASAESDCRMFRIEYIKFIFVHVESLETSKAGETFFFSIRPSFRYYYYKNVFCTLCSIVWAGDLNIHTLSKDEAGHRLEYHVKTCTNGNKIYR